MSRATSKNRAKTGRRWKIAAPLAAWKKAGFRQGKRERRRRLTIAQLCLVWAKNPAVQEKLFGQRGSWLDIHNRIRRIFGQPPLELKDVPPNEHWDAVPTRKQRNTAAYAMFGLTPEGERIQDPDKLGYFGPPVPEANSKNTQS